MKFNILIYSQYKKEKNLRGHWKNLKSSKN